MIRICTLVFCCTFFATTVLLAQQPNKTDIKGLVADTSGAPLPFATVMLLDARDSTLVNFSRTGDNGTFTFHNVKNAAYIFKVSYIGSIPHTQAIAASPGEVSDLGTIVLKPISKELMEVVVKTAKAPLWIRGDTIEYDATTFKVPPGSTVEDLLRRLPGITVDAQGAIKAQGMDVRRVYVDGKTFFGDDPTIATKNLDAEVISRVQVYNDKSEQAKLTGIDDGKVEKAMNLALKDEFKKGAFGKITGAIGTEERWASKGNYNRFDAKRQFSAIGYGNNINQTGVNWEDYSEFRGSSPYVRSETEFGFNRNGREFSYEPSDFSSPVSYFDGRGLTKNAGGGLNYNYNTDKTTFNSNYFYNQTALRFTQNTYRETYTDDGSFYNTDTTENSTFRRNHTLNIRLDQMLDSANQITANSNIRFSPTHNQTDQQQSFFSEPSVLTNNLNLMNESNQNLWAVNVSALYRHKFKKKGHSLAANTVYTNNINSGDDHLNSENRAFETATFTEQVRRLNDNKSTVPQVKANLLFTMPFTKKLFWENFYNFTRTENKLSRQATDPEQNFARIDSLSIYNRSVVAYNRLGTTVRYAYNGLNLAFGNAVQQLTVDTRNAVDRTAPLLAPPVHNSYINWVPNVSASLQLPNNARISANYGYSIQEPRINDLLPVPNVSNPAFRSEGNPNLTPERYHTVSFSAAYWNSAAFSNIYFNSSFTKFDNQIVYFQTTERIDSLGLRTTSRPENVAGGNRENASLGYEFPLIKTKLTGNINASANASSSISAVNAVQNITKNNGVRFSISFNATPSPKLVLGLGGGVGFSQIKYSILVQQNQKIQNHSADASVKWQFAPRLFLESNYNFAYYHNDRFGSSDNIPTLNASLRQVLGKKNRVELRLAAFDMLNRQSKISQFGSQNYFTRTVTNTLTRYYMLSLSYNIRGYQTKIQTKPGMIFG